MTPATDHPIALFLFVLVNITITLGYVFLAATVVPKVPVTLVQTKVGGVGFFLLCGLTHTDMALSALFHPEMTMGEMATSWHMLAIHIPQAICVWLFVTGLYIEVGRWDFLKHRDLEASAPGRRQDAAAPDADPDVTSEQAP